MNYFRRLFKNRGVGINLLASFCFLMLVVYGWGITWQELGNFLFVLVVLLVGLIAAAAFCGWLLRKVLRTRERPLVDNNLLDDAPEKKEQNKTD